EAVRAARDDRLHLVAVERADGVFGEHLVEILIAHPARRVAVAVLFLAENGELDPARLEDSRKSDRDLLRAIVERAHAPDPEQHVRPLAALERFGHRRDVHPVGPARTVARTERPGRPIALERLERRLDFLWEARLGEHEVAPQLVDDLELVDRHRALLYAGAAARAGPELRFADVGVEQPMLAEDRFRRRRCGVASLAVDQ